MKMKKPKNSKKNVRPEYFEEYRGQVEEDGEIDNRGWRQESRLRGLEQENEGAAGAERGARQQWGDDDLTDEDVSERVEKSDRGRREKR